MYTVICFYSLALFGANLRHYIISALIILGCISFFFFFGKDTDYLKKSENYYQNRDKLTIIPSYHPIPGRCSNFQLSYTYHNFIFVWYRLKSILLMATNWCVFQSLYIDSLPFYLSPFTYNLFVEETRVSFLDSFQMIWFNGCIHVV